MKEFFVVLVVFTALVVASCSYDCSPNGSCEEDVCVCSPGFAGIDCSVSDQELTLNDGGLSEQRVDYRKWKHYHVRVSLVPELVIEVNQSSDSGDADTYVRLGDYASKDVNDFRDITTDRNIRIVIPDATGVYYIGIYGFLSTEYTIEAIGESICNLQCPTHGSCTISSGEATCLCDPGYVGDDCSIQAEPMTNSEIYNASITQYSWKYYTIKNMNNTIEIYLNQTGDTIHEDCGMYIKFDGIPYLNSYDYRDLTALTSANLKIPGAKKGVYIYGVYGYQDCSFTTMSVTYTTECPNNCSGNTHGTCNISYMCSCNDIFEGNTCEKMIPPLQMETNVSGFVDRSNWNYYYFSATSSWNAYVNLKYDDMYNENCDMYIARDRMPNFSSYDYSDVTFLINKTIVIENPDPGVQYHIGVFGYEPCTYSLRFGLTMECPDNCGYNGHCSITGKCVCDNGWGGDDCTIKYSRLENRVPVDDTVNIHIWKYYTFEVKATYDVIILMEENNSTGNLWLYESADTFPRNSYYDQSDTETNASIHSILFTPEAAGTVYVAVQTSPLVIPSENFEFSLVASQATLEGSMKLVPSFQEISAIIK